MELRTIDTIIAVDVGAGGGIAVWRDGKITTYNMPKNLKDLNVLFSYLAEISDNPICFIEQVQMYLGDAKGGKQFGIVKMLANFEQLKAIISVNKIPFIPVYPITWQSKLKLRIKGEEKAVRKRRYKEVAQLENQHLRVTMKTCDALLILKFARIVLENDKNWVLERLPENNSIF